VVRAGTGRDQADDRLMDLLSETIAWLTDPANWSGPSGIPTRTAEHIVLSAASLLIALAIALPLGLWVGHTRRATRVVVNIANLGRAVPTLAVIALVLPITAAIDPQSGFKIYPAVIAMVVLAIPPILVNAQTGVMGVDADLVEAGRGMGMRGGQLLRRVEVPVALPIILGGVRSAAVQVVATLTLAAIFGGPGLGRYLVEGIAQVDDGMLFGGVVLVAGLSLVTEASFALLGRLIVSPGVRGPTAEPWIAGPLGATR
jgi:osmoprotectant transport system permease protein